MRRTADGVLVCCHDPDLGRLLGRGPGHGPVVAESTYAELRAVRLQGGGLVPRVEEVLDAAAGRGAVVVVEVKPVAGPDRLRTASAVADLLTARERARSGLGRVTTSSFDPLAAAALARRRSGPSALLVETSTDPDAAVALALSCGVDELHLPVATLRRAPAVADRAHRRGLGLVVWTVNEPSDVLQAAALGARAVISDDPAGAVATLRGATSVVRPRRAALPVRP